MGKTDKGKNRFKIDKLIFRFYDYVLLKYNFNKIKIKNYERRKFNSAR